MSPYKAQVAKQLNEPAECQDVAQAVGLQGPTDRLTQAVSEGDALWLVGLIDQAPAARAGDGRRKSPERKPGLCSALRALHIGTANEEMAPLRPGNPVGGPCRTPHRVYELVERDRPSFAGSPGDRS